MRIPSGKTDQKIYFDAVDPLTGAAKTGLSSFTVRRSRNGGATAAMATPAVTELDSVNAPGCYYFSANEDTTIASTSDSEMMAFHITQAIMAPVRTYIELYRRDTTTGNTLAITSSGHVSTVDTLTTYTGDTPQTGDSYARLGAAGSGLTALGDTRIAHLDADISSRTKPADTQAAVTTVGSVTGSVGSVVGLTVSNLDATVSSRLAASGYTTPDNAGIALIKAKTDNLPAAPADESLIIAATNALATSIAALPTTTTVNAIKAKTDSLNFTVSGKADANVTHVNTHAVTGDGHSGTEWGPA